MTASNLAEKLSSQTPELETLKARQHATWSSGNYAVVGTTLQIVGEQLCEALDLRAGQKVLDVASGNGNAALAAARRYGEVTASDYVPALLEGARRRAEADGLSLTIREADAEALPFPTASFDIVTSVFGVMFTADHDRAAAEMVRVLKPAGKIGMANWTPEGFIGELFKVIGKHVPPAPGAKSPALWGTEERLNQMFGTSAATMQVARRNFTFRYRSPEHWVEVFRTYYGPTLKAFGALDDAGKRSLEQDILGLIGRFNRSHDGTLVVPSEYLEIVITRH